MGTLLAEDLCHQKHDIVLVDKSKNEINIIKDQLDIMCIEGDASHPDVIEEAGMCDSDIVLAVSGDDKTNILCALTANLRGVKTTIAKVRNPVYAGYVNMLKQEGIAVVNPGEIISTNIKKIVTESHFAWSSRKIADGKIDLFKLKINEKAPVLENSLKNLDISPWILVGVAREGNMVIPSGDTVLMPGDNVYALGDASAFDNLKAALGITEDKKLKNIIIVGAGLLGSLTASLLHQSGTTVKVIESDPDAAAELADNVPGIIVLRGDGTDAQIQKEAGIEVADYFFALTGDDGENILSSLLARRLGAKKNMVLYTKPDYMDVLETTGIDAGISVRLSVVNEILAMLDIGKTVKTTLLEEGRGEIMEFVVGEDSNIRGTSLQNAGLPEGCIVGACIRGDKTIIPRGNFTPQINDRVIIFTLPESIHKVEKAIS